MRRAMGEVSSAPSEKDTKGKKKESKAQLEQRLAKELREKKDEERRIQNEKDKIAREKLNKLQDEMEKERRRGIREERERREREKREEQSKQQNELENNESSSEDENNKKRKKTAIERSSSADSNEPQRKRGRRHERNDQPESSKKQAEPNKKKKRISESSDEDSSYEDLPEQSSTPVAAPISERTSSSTSSLSPSTTKSGTSSSAKTGGTPFTPLPPSKFPGQKERSSHLNDSSKVGLHWKANAAEMPRIPKRKTDDKPKAPPAQSSALSRPTTLPSTSFAPSHHPPPNVFTPTSIQTHQSKERQKAGASNAFVSPPQNAASVAARAQRVSSDNSTERRAPTVKQPPHKMKDMTGLGDNSPVDAIMKDMDKGNTKSTTNSLMPPVEKRARIDGGSRGGGEGGPSTSYASSGVSYADGRSGRSPSERSPSINSPSYSPANSFDSSPRSDGGRQTRNGPPSTHSPVQPPAEKAKRCPYTYPENPWEFNSNCPDNMPMIKNVPRIFRNKKNTSANAAAPIPAAAPTVTPPSPVKEPVIPIRKTRIPTPDIPGTSAEANIQHSDVAQPKTPATAASVVIQKPAVVAKEPPKNWMPILDNIPKSVSAAAPVATPPPTIAPQSSKPRDPRSGAPSSTQLQDPRRVQPGTSSTQRVNTPVVSKAGDASTQKATATVHPQQKLPMQAVPPPAEPAVVTLSPTQTAAIPSHVPAVAANLPAPAARAPSVAAVAAPIRNPLDPRGGNGFPKGWNEERMKLEEWEAKNRRAIHVRYGNYMLKRVDEDALDWTRIQRLAVFKRATAHAKHQKRSGQAEEDDNMCARLGCLTHAMTTQPIDLKSYTRTIPLESEEEVPTSSRPPPPRDNQGPLFEFRPEGSGGGSNGPSTSSANLTPGLDDGFLPDKRPDMVKRKERPEEKAARDKFAEDVRLHFAKMDVQHKAAQKKKNSLEVSQRVTANLLECEQREKQEQYGGRDGASGSNTPSTSAHRAPNGSESRSDMGAILNERRPRREQYLQGERERVQRLNRIAQTSNNIAQRGVVGDARKPLTTITAAPTARTNSRASSVSSTSNTPAASSRPNVPLAMSTPSTSDQLPSSSTTPTPVPTATDDSARPTSRSSNEENSVPSSSTPSEEPTSSIDINDARRRAAEKKAQLVANPNLVQAALHPPAFVPRMAPIIPLCSAVYQTYTPCQSATLPGPSSQSHIIPPTGIDPNAPPPHRVFPLGTFSIPSHLPLPLPQQHTPNHPLAQPGVFSVSANPIHTTTLHSSIAQNGTGKRDVAAIAPTVRGEAGSSRANGEEEMEIEEEVNDPPASTSQGTENGRIDDEDRPGPSNAPLTASQSNNGEREPDEDPPKDMKFHSIVLSVPKYRIPADWTQPTYEEYARTFIVFKFNKALTTEEDIRQLYSKFGRIEEIRTCYYQNKLLSFIMRFERHKDYKSVRMSKPEENVLHGEPVKLIDYLERPISSDLYH